MDANTILILILSLVVFDYILEQLLDLLNLRHQKKNLPTELEGIYDKDKYLKSLAYQKDQGRLSFISGTWSFLILVVILLSGGLGILDEIVRQNVGAPTLIPLVFFFILFVAADLIGLPFQLYNTFVLEERYGFNKTTIKLFLVDKLKGYLLAMVLGGAILWALIFLINSIGESFWVYFLLIMAMFTVIMNMFYTSLILPLFNKLTPLEDGELKAAIHHYSQKINFPVHNIFIIDGSKRSNKANAFFSGFGKKKKIVMYDTLIKNHSTEELVAVLAHEVGHYKKKHIITNLFLSVFQMAVMLFILSNMIFNEELSLALGAKGWGIHLNLIAFTFLYTPISKITGLLMNVLSRKNEFEADAYATQTYNGDALKLALKKLSVDNLSNLLPHNLYVFFNYSHPPLLQRLKAIDLKQKQLS